MFSRAQRAQRSKPPRPKGVPSFNARDGVGTNRCRREELRTGTRMEGTGPSAGGRQDRRRIPLEQCPAACFCQGHGGGRPWLPISARQKEAPPPRQGPLVGPHGEEHALEKIRQRRQGDTVRRHRLQQILSERWRAGALRSLHAGYISRIHWANASICRVRRVHRE